MSLFGRLLVMILVVTLATVAYVQPEAVPGGGNEVSAASIELVADQYPWPHNGCTSAPNIVGGANFTHPCNQHDECYARHWAERSTCDSWFRNDMLAICKRMPFDLVAACVVNGGIYYSAVRLFGGRFYNSDGEYVRINTPMRVA